ncbi:14290_t:CDS:2 [Funneliformis geosporum]|uniref:3271_t:CDS:1 n=1 Tax=Funneliformis geosporum TaxID=1117311 RepID=A0A9W4SJJ6_9GLOM|nr:14290_t:CDS:2 [Funneliformis geosporum]CAI2170610.1 3271_t:CDS:2 [Funneliformis geosporum]
MEQAKSTQKSTKKFFNKIFHTHNSSKKNSSSVSPHAFDAFEIVPRTIKNLRSGSIQRRYSFSNVHESGQRRLLAAKRAEYQEKMQAFDDLISKRRGSTLRMALAPDVTSY